jgi:predicted RNA binding protein YcfA (HicA-like mRNA interferase family)
LKLNPVRGDKLVKILCNSFGFRILRQKGSHLTINRENLYVTIPVKEIQVGLLNRILKDCGIKREEFLRYT